MLIAINGSQGSGKSTLLDELQTLGYQTIKRKTSRSILKDWGVTLHEVNSDDQLTLKFQDEIIKRKYEDEYQARHDSQVWFTERCFSDLFTYALVNLGVDNKYSDWLDNYYAQCVQFNEIYDKVIYLKGGLFPVQADGVRSSNQHYSRLVDLTMEDNTKRMTSEDKFDIITVAGIEDRIKHIQNIINKG